MAKFGNDYVNVYIYSGTLKEMLNDRFDEMWSKDLTMDEVEMYHNAFNDMVDGEAFNGQEFDVSVIVDNFFVNDSRIVRPDDFDYDEIVEKIENEDITYYDSCEDENGETVYLIPAR